MKKITKAILPVAGFGTRFLPATKVQPKEMLSIFDTPAIEFIVEEAVEAGIEEIILITGRGKRAIEDHFDRNVELENLLKSREKFAELAKIQRISRMANFSYVRQPEPLGDGHAILCAKNLIAPDESVLVLFGDDIVDNGKGKNSVQQLMEIYEKTQNPVILLQKIDQKDSEKYGIVKISREFQQAGEILDVVEKPKPNEAPSDLAIVGKYIITPEILQNLAKLEADKSGEIRLSAAFQQYLQNGGQLMGKVLEGKRFDIGDKLGFLEATLHFALKKEGDKAQQIIEKFARGK